MALTAWGDGYIMATICELAGTGLATVALKEGTTPTQVWYRRSLDDGETWTDAILIGTLSPPRGVQVLQKNRSRSARMIATDGIANMWKSEDFGKTWSVF